MPEIQIGARRRMFTADPVVTRSYAVPSNDVGFSALAKGDLHPVCVSKQQSGSPGRAGMGPLGVLRWLGLIRGEPDERLPAARRAPFWLTLRWLAPWCRAMRPFRRLLILPFSCALYWLSCRPGQWNDLSARTTHCRQRRSAKQPTGQPVEVRAIRSTRDA